MNEQEFYEKYYKTAKLASQNLAGALAPETILSFWYWETAGGTNRGARELNNLGGIKYVGQDTKYGIDASKSGMYANYSSLEEFAKDYARVLNLSYYDSVLEAGRTPGYEDDIKAINDSPYAEADYDPGTILRSIQAFLGLQGSKTDSSSTVTSTESLEGQFNRLTEEQVKQYAIIGLGVALLFMTLTK